MKIVSGMQGTRNQEINSENKDEKQTTKREDVPTKRRQEDQGKKKQRKETRGKESIITPVKLLGKWFKK